MNVILFDLGRTLETDDVLLPGAADMLIAVAALRDASGKPLGMGLVSDFTMPLTTADIPEIRKEYIAILDRLRIRNFFEPVDRGDVGMVQRGEELRFASKPCDARSANPLRASPRPPAYRCGP